MIRQKYQYTIAVPAFIILSILLLLYEIVNYYCSTYQPNSILFLRSFFILVACAVCLHKLLSNKKYKTYFIVIISSLTGLMAFFNLPVFFFRYYEAGIYGFNDFSQFRFLYLPLGFLSNEWITILLCLLPFPIIGLFLLWKKTLARYGFLLIVGLIIFNIFISFSRAGILAFLLFVGLLNILFYFNHIFSIKKLLIYNGILILFLGLFTLGFSESVRSSVYQTSSHQRSTEGRLKQWEEVINIAYKYPVLGIGSKNYALINQQHQQIKFDAAFTGRINNTYIQLLLEKGWIGLLLWIGIISILVFRLFRQIQKEKKLPDRAISCILFSAVLAILFREIFFSSLLYNSGILLLFFILLTFNYQNNKFIKIRKPVVILFIVLFILSGIYFYFKKPENALLYASNGLAQERSVDIRIPYDQLNTYSKKISNRDNDTITEAIQQYKKACRLSPHDALFQHNLGWLYWMNHQPDSAMIYISKAIKIDPNNAIYHISQGLIIESQQPDIAFETYKQAILLSPDISDSPFFGDLKKRNPVKAREIMQKAYDEIRQLQSVRYSSILEAKTGKILLALGDTDAAFKILTHVTQIHPNLNRPWYYLGFIEQKKGDFDAMQIHYKTSLFLAPSDHLPLYALAAYYENRGDQQQAGSYYKSAEKAWKNKRSVHSSRCKRMYFMETEKNDVIPQGLLNYISPVFKLKTDDTD